MSEMARFKRFVAQFSRIVFIFSCIVIITLTCCFNNQVSAFRLSFSNRLSQNPQLNPASTLIRPIECRNAHNHSEAGICMFSIDCIQNKGVPLSVCKHNYFVGTCCRLPDYNNFVGIVYDLRNTENSANQLVEARKFSSSSSAGLGSLFSLMPPTSSSASSQTASSTTRAQLSVTEAPPVQPNQQQQQQQETNPSSAQASSTWSTEALISSQSFTTHNPESLSSAASPASSTTTTTLNPTIVSDLLQENGAAYSKQDADVAARYVISSTSLFPTTSSGTTASSLLPTTTYLAAPASPMANSNSPLTANALLDNLVEQVKQQQKEQQQQQQNTLYTVEQSNAGSASQGQELQMQSVVFANNHQQISSSTLRPPPPVQPSSSSSSFSTTQNFHQETPYTSTSTSPSTDLTSTSARVLPPSTSSGFSRLPATSDQEFTLSTSNLSSPSEVETNNHISEKHPQSTSSIEYSTSPSTSSSSGSSITTTQYEFSHDNSSTFTGSTPLLLPQYQYQVAEGSSSLSPSAASNSSSHNQTEDLDSSSSSPFVDLVSSNAAQTTTPFTTSLSTALLPNVSSHPYSPTVPPSVQVTSSPLVPNPAQNLSITSNSSSNSEQASTSSNLSSSSTSATSSPSSFSPPSSSSTSSSSSSASPFSHLYSNQHSSNQHLPGELSHNNYYHHQQQQKLPLVPSMPGSNLAGLQAASKIVTGSSSGNNLMPSLSGLHSAILSHIPFKIASGLSNGLSNYLQAVMKPPSNGAPGNRPLISSNNAPSLQYQQQMQANATKQQQQQHQSGTAQAPSSSGSSIRFPTISSPSPSPSSPAAESIESNLIVSSSNTTTSSPILPSSASPWFIQSTGLTSSSTTVSVPLLTHDIVREAQLVCGRPQVSQAAGEMKKRVARIVGGNQSLFGQWPWMVSLRQWRKGAFLHKCGAALLNENWAVTAAHCVENVKVNDLLLRLGEFDVSNQDEPYPYAERRVRSVVSHPLFDPKTFEYDLALIKFAEPIKYDRNIIPVCVPSGNDSYVDRMATVIGWGRLYEDGPLPDVIQHVDVPIITNKECEKMYKNAGYIEEIPDMFICAGISKGGRDSCEGDSGGPLTMVDHDGKSYLVGIISWGIGCALPSQPGVYTRITAFSGWINQIIGS